MITLFSVLLVLVLLGNLAAFLSWVYAFFADRKHSMEEESGEEGSDSITVANGRPIFQGGARWWALGLSSAIVFSIANIVPTPLIENLDGYLTEIPEANPVTKDKIELGRRLFDEPSLSSKGYACSTCHRPEAAFSNGGALKEVLASEHSVPTLWGVGYQKRLFWKATDSSLEQQLLTSWIGEKTLAVPDPKERDRRSRELAKNPAYEAMFQRAFGHAPTPQSVIDAFASYMRTLTPVNSAWARFNLGAGDDQALTDAAKRGWEVFQSKGCNSCHQGLALTDFLTHELPINGDPGAYKTPVLFDVSKTAPYFHDGSSPTLKDVIARKSKIHGVEFLEDETSQLINFLNELNVDPVDDEYLRENK